MRFLRTQADFKHSIVITTLRLTAQALLTEATLTDGTDGKDGSK